jgi:hypothetical protein
MRLSFIYFICVLLHFGGARLGLVSPTSFQLHAALLVVSPFTNNKIKLYPVHTAQ